MRLAALLGAISLIVFAIFQGEQDSSPNERWFAVKKIEIEGRLINAKRQELEIAYDVLLGESLLTLSLSQAETVAVSPEWVASARIRKVWPDKIVVEVKEHQPIAYWNSRQIVTSNGEVISPRHGETLPLANLKGPDSSSQVVLDQFGLMSQMLSNSSLRIKELVLEKRGAWNIKFQNDVYVKLGRDKVLERLQRFIAVYKSDLSGKIENVLSVDARYPHGVAVQWNEKL
ncbi:cell division protein FtsQ/DivIB [Marinomonas mediterranea]|jgi:Cell division septal protein|uniref:Cell division protein FtsQ n=1 Tax=Marinomonas mediterranea (strain ATCC 700492 / JCM 21426 / NBRC 103028 / MMB-1) TaxID=717774 RepID=F2JVW5_MARM1|nr:cell division protein FtsQ/DivIB [Marinomonas mediterranea]ADZ91751.1 cell division protein FtsQ [Marinomonas mediterranea MMB-1]WCN09709.1 FtsQ-type POTRA domain-containing protein [Marinomonas mediterranea]WCN13790.1 FtsQ-type POTRA domain-containing protein [Marinomonas mediterranea]WCN17846.1 FtsQ-type POTRA domain-containing protein [Marinomonas mediterranea MMB-1]